MKTAATTERPILFSGPMVRAIIDGRKTQTRRVVKLSPDIKRMGGDLNKAWSDKGLGAGGYLHVGCADESQQRLRCPYGSIGSSLWVRETFCEQAIYGRGSGHEAVLYRADVDRCGQCPVKDEAGNEFFVTPKEDWRPSIFMPRKHSRITLEVTDVRVERVQQISEEDAYSEGVEFSHQIANRAWYLVEKRCDWIASDCREAFESLWNQINKKRGYGWETNPWVWAITFRRVV